MTSITDALAAAFPPENVSWRVGSTTADKKKGMALAFIDARDVMERLDTVCGAANWQDRYEFHGSRTLCYLSIRIDGEWIARRPPPTERRDAGGARPAENGGPRL